METISAFGRKKRLEQTHHRYDVRNKKMKDYRSGLVLRVGLKGDISKLGFTNSTVKIQIGESSEMLGDPTKHDWLPQDITYSPLSYMTRLQIIQCITQLI